MQKDSIVLHHSASTAKDPQYDNIVRYHNNGAGGKIRPGRGMAYHYFIGRDGTVKNAHSEDFVCDNSGNWVMNQRSIAICLAGDFTQEEPTDKQIYSMTNLMTEIQQRWGIPDARIIHHWEVTPKHTTCPRIDLRARAIALRQEKMKDRIIRLQKVLNGAEGMRRAKIARLIDRLQKLTPTYPVSI